MLQRRTTRTTTMKLNFLQLATLATSVFAADPQALEIWDIAKGQAAIFVSSPYRVAFTSNKLNQLLAVRLAKQTPKNNEDTRQILKKEEAEELGKLIGLRTDVQTGSTPSNSGTTSLAMKGAVPKILGFALENGAIESSTKGTVVTFRATPWGVIKALKGSGYLDILDSLESNGEAGFLKKISVAASFDTSKGVESPTLLANRQQLQSWSVRSEIFNNRDASLRSYHQFWGQLADQAVAGLETKEGIVYANLKLNPEMNKWPELMSWYSESQKRVLDEIETPALAGTILETAFLKIAEEQLVKFDKLNPPETVVVAIKTYVPALKSVLISRNAIANYAQRGALATVDFTVKRDPVLPDLSTLTGIWETHIGKRS